VPVTLQCFKDVGEALKVWAEFIAYGSGGAFLIFKIGSGYFITDLSLNISCERFSLSDDLDNLSVTALVKKGEKNTIRIHDARIRITDLAGNFIDERKMIGIERLSFKTDSSERISITFRPSLNKPWLSLPPGDETQFAGLCEVPSARSFTVEVVILGKKLWGGKVAQWRASAVSFPNALK
jgi:hypothetical protein